MNARQPQHVQAHVAKGRQVLRTVAHIGTTCILAQTDARYAAARGWVDRLIDPAQTREELIEGLTLVTRQAIDESFRLGVFQV